MTSKQKQIVEEFGNSIAELLTSVNVINYKMDLNKMTVSIDIDANNIDTGLLEDTQFEINQLTINIQK